MVAVSLPSARMHSEVSSRFVCSVCVCVCVCVDAYSGTTDYEVANERYIPTASELREPENNSAIFLKRLHSP